MTGKHFARILFWFASEVYARGTYQIEDEMIALYTLAFTLKVTPYNDDVHYLHSLSKQRAQKLITSAEYDRCLDQERERYKQALLEMTVNDWVEALDKYFKL